MSLRFWFILWWPGHHGHYGIALFTVPEKESAARSLSVVNKLNDIRHLPFVQITVSLSHQVLDVIAVDKVSPFPLTHFGQCGSRDIVECLLWMERRQVEPEVNVI